MGNVGKTAEASVVNLIRRTTTVSQGLVRRAKHYLARLAPAASIARRRISAAAARAGRRAGPSEPLALHVIPAQANSVTLQRRNSDASLMSDAGQQVLRLNDTAVSLWELCDGGKTVTEIAAVLAWRFQEDENRVQQDVLAALQQFEARGFVYRSRREPQITATP